MRPRKDHYWRNLLFALFSIIGFYLFGMVFWVPIRDFLMQFPWFSYFYNLIMTEIGRKSVLGLSLITLIGSLFFIGFPGELLFLGYVRAGYSVYYISLVMLLFGMIAQAINYGFGYFLEKKFLETYVKENKREFKKSLKKYDSTFIILINLIPLPADILTVILGMVKYDFRKAMLFSAIGKLLKFVFLAVLLLILKISLA